MVASSHSAAADIQTSVPTDFKTQATLSATPQYFKATFLLIVANPGDSQEQHFKRLMKLVTYDDNEHLTSFAISAAIFRCANTKFYDELISVLVKCGCLTDVVTLDDFMQLHPKLLPADINNIEKYDSMEPSHFVFGISLLAMIIGKKLTPANYSNWCINRTKTYAAPLGLHSLDQILGDLIPSLPFASSMYDDVKVFYQVRRLYFMNIYGMATRDDLLGAGMKITKALLKYTELTNWSFIRYWIVQLNPD